MELSTDPLNIDSSLRYYDVLHHPILSKDYTPSDLIFVPHDLPIAPKIFPQFFVYVSLVHFSDYVKYQ